MPSFSAIRTAPENKNGPHRTVKAACMFSQPEGYSTGISLLTFFEPTRA